jgi:phage terminase large subunit-like protein
MAVALAIAELETERETVEADPEPALDLCDSIERNFYVYQGREPSLIHLEPHQKAILRYAFRRLPDGRLPFSIIIYSTIKKSGKSTIAAAVARWFAEEQVRAGSVFCVGNDARQARERSFEFIRQSIAATPGFLPGRDVLPGRWECLQNTLRCLSDGTKVEALAVDARGEAGGSPALSVWTELWGFETREALRFWDELTPVPTLPDSIRLVETYAGYDGESDLLRGLYDAGMEGRRLRNGELAEVAARPGVEGEEYADFLQSFADTHGDPEALLPIWVREDTGQFMYWDSGLEARRMPWQQGEEGDKYYREREAQEPPKAFRRLHFNEWVGAESAFVPLEVWDARMDPALPDFRILREDGKAADQSGCVIAVDAASTGDCFGVLAVTRHPTRLKEPAIRAAAVWEPNPRIDYSAVEATLRDMIKRYNVVEVAYDPYQLEDMMQRLKRDGVARCRQFNQMGDRLRADRQLYDLIMNGGLSWSPDLNPAVRQHVANANAKLQKDEASKMRIVKKAANRPIDLVVCASMAVHRCQKLLMENA